MTGLLNISAALLFVLAIFIASCQWGSVISRWWQSRRGETKSFSMFPLAQQVFVGLSAVVFSIAGTFQIPAWCFWAVALSDVYLLMLVIFGSRKLFSLFRSW